jgi:hypothetical protein
MPSGKRVKASNPLVDHYSEQLSEIADPGLNFRVPAPASNPQRHNAGKQSDRIAYWPDLCLRVRSCTAMWQWVWLKPETACRG